jgi:cytochrome P450
MYLHFFGLQITAQGVIFFVAGFETTANTLSTLSYNLAKHPEVQVADLIPSLLMGAYYWCQQQ